MSNFYVGEVLFEDGGTIDTPGDITVTSILDCAGTTGTAGQILSSTGTALEWIAAAGGGGIPCSVITAKGDIVVGTASSTPAVLPVGTFNQVLLADSGCAAGMKWGALPQASITGLGVMYGCVTNAAPNNTSVGYFTLPYSSTTCTIAIGNNSMIGATGDSHIAIGVGIANPTGATGCNVFIGNRIGSGNAQNAASNVIVGQFAACSGLDGSSRNVILGANAATALSFAFNNVVIGYGVAPPTSSSDCTLAIGYDTGCHWLTGNSTKAIKPGAGIIDCAGSCGTVGQVLMSNGSNAICWGTAGGGGGSAATPTAQGLVLGLTDLGNTALGCQSLNTTATGVGNIAIGYLSGSALTSGTANTFVGGRAGCSILGGGFNTGIGCSALNSLTTGCVNTAIGLNAGCALTTECYNTIVGCHPGFAGESNRVILADGSGQTRVVINDCGALSTDNIAYGTTGQVLVSNGPSAAFSWATPQTSPYVTYTTSAVTYTSGTPVLVAVWGGGTIQGTVTLDLVGYGGVNQFWDFYLSGDPTNYNTGWYQYATWPDPSNALSQGTWYVDFPVYPDPNANLWELYFNPAQNSLNASSFTFFYRPLPGSAVPAWQI